MSLSLDQDEDDDEEKEENTQQDKEPKVCWTIRVVLGNQVPWLWIKGTIYLEVNHGSLDCPKYADGWKAGYPGYTDVLDARRRRSVLVHYHPIEFASNPNTRGPNPSTRQSQVEKVNQNFTICYRQDEIA